MLFLLLLQCLAFANCYNILVVNNLPLVSNNEVARAVVTHLLEIGHQITFITSDSIEENNNLTQVIYDIEEPIAKTGTLNISNWYHDARVGISEYFDISIRTTVKMIKTKPVQDLLKNNKVNYDLVVAFWNFNELVSGMSALFGCPLLWVSTHEPNKLSLNVLLHGAETNIFNTIIEPETLSDNLNAVLQNVKLHLLYAESKSIEGKFYSKIYSQAASVRSVKMPPYLELVSNSSMMLFMTHPSIGKGDAMPPNAKFVGGAHFDDHEELLPEDLKQILDTHEQGVIYFNLGKDVDSSTLPKDIVLDLVKLFGEMKQVVFWKYEGHLTDVPPNVIVRKALPQRPILAHLNTLVFINDGELSSLNEAVHYGVPVIAIPLYLDQYFNAHLLVKKSYGLKVSFGRSLASQLKIALMTILQDPSYSESAQELSDAYNDRILEPAEELVLWIEHVIHTKGGRYLASPGYQMPWYAQNSMHLDQTILSFAILFLTIFCSYKLCRKYCCKPTFTDCKDN